MPSSGGPMRVPRYALFGALALGLGACTDPLAVNNSNNPDRKRVFGAASDLESFVGSTYAIAHAGTLGAASVLSGGSNDGLQPQLLTMGMESVSGLANFAMGPRSSICTSGGCSGRTAIDNGINSQGNIGNLRDFIIEHRAARLATLGLARLQVLGSLGSATRDGRARAFGKFVEGVALGNLALAYDSAAIVTESNTDSADVPLSSYTDVMAAALGDLDSAITIAGTVSTSSDGFPLPANWINEASATISKTLFLQFVHSYKARFLAGVARTKAERDAVNWGRVITEVNAGITSDFNVLMSPTNGWDVAWPLQHYATGSASWHQMSQFFLGMADVSGGYDAFLAKAPTTRTPFVVVTPDRRFPQGATRAAQQADTQPVNFGSTRYFRNRPTGEDAPGDPLQISMYDFRRSFEFQVTNTRNGAYPIMTAAEIRLLKAEALLRQGGAANIDTAAKLINISRAAKGGLPALDTLAVDTSAVVPGGSSCVPRVPDSAASYKATKCGNMWDALKWEYRLETAYTGYGMWYFAGRGWGDLPEGTPIEWPVPYQELQVRQVPIYGRGGVGSSTGAAPGNYGLFSGGVY